MPPPAAITQMFHFDVDPLTFETSSFYLLPQLHHQSKCSVHRFVRYHANRSGMHAQMKACTHGLTARKQCHKHTYRCTEALIGAMETSCFLGCYPWMLPCLRLSMLTGQSQGHEVKYWRELLLWGGISQGGHRPGKPGILRDFSEHGKLREFCATFGKYCNKQSIFSSSFKFLCKTAVDWVNRIVRISGSSDPAQ